MLLKYLASPRRCYKTPELFIYCLLCRENGVIERKAAPRALPDLFEYVSDSQVLHPELEATLGER